MHKGRLEAFTDAVIAIVMTIMVLELKAPSGYSLEALRPLAPVASAYVLSFLYLAIYWNNHHHMLQIATHVNGSVLWANTHLLFWLSLVPAGTAWVGSSGLATVPVAIYGGLLLANGIAYYVLVHTLIRANGRDSQFAQATGAKTKEILSLVIYASGIAVAFLSPNISVALYLVVALMWLIPDLRYERSVRSN